MKKSSELGISLSLGAILLALLVIIAQPLLNGKIRSSSDFDSVSAAVMQSLDAQIYPEVSASQTRHYLDLDPSQFTSIALYRNKDAMSANELAIAQFENEEAAKAFEDAVNKRISAQTDIFSGYAPEQAALMKDAIVDVHDNYALYYVGNDGAQIDALFQKALKGGV